MIFIHSLRRYCMKMISLSELREIPRVMADFNPTHSVVTGYLRNCSTCKVKKVPTKFPSHFKDKRTGDSPSTTEMALAYNRRDVHLMGATQQQDISMRTTGKSVHVRDDIYAKTNFYIEQTHQYIPTNWTCSSTFVLSPEAVQNIKWTKVYSTIYFMLTALGCAWTNALYLFG